MSKYLILTALLLGSAFAQTTTPTTPTTTTVALPGTIPASVQSELAALKTFLTSGGKVELIGAGGTVIGTLNADGTVTLNGTSTLSDGVSVRVTAPDGKATSYTLARDLSKPGAIKFQYTLPNGKVASLPLSAIVNRMTKAKGTQTTAPTATPTTDDSKGKDKGAKPERPTKPERPVKGKK
ncbi:hypothetical protein [Deinococcus hohokamensis]|uniref:Uncharacterized protein n=1 Tax=Deinococcus hohokamensis TaxID=309883 RepID=A0ABV9I5H6_9DEIO